MNCSSDGFITVLSLSPEWEEVFSSSIIGEGDDKTISIAPSKLQEFTGKVRRMYDEQAAKNLVPVILTTATNRPYIRAVIERFRSNISVMSQNEIHQRAKIRTVGVI